MKPNSAEQLKQWGRKLKENVNVKPSAWCINLRERQCGDGQRVTFQVILQHINMGSSSFAVGNVGEIIEAHVQPASVKSNHDSHQSWQCGTTSKFEAPRVHM